MQPIIAGDPPPGQARWQTTCNALRYWTWSICAHTWTSVFHRYDQESKKENLVRSMLHNMTLRTLLYTPSPCWWQRVNTKQIRVNHVTRQMSELKWLLRRLVLVTWTLNDTSRTDLGVSVENCPRQDDQESKHSGRQAVAPHCLPPCPPTDAFLMQVTPATKVTSAATLIVLTTLFINDSLDCCRWRYGGRTVSCCKSMALRTLGRGVLKLSGGCIVKVIDCRVCVATLLRAALLTWSKASPMSPNDDSKSWATISVLTGTKINRCTFLYISNSHRWPRAEKHKWYRVNT